MARRGHGGSGSTRAIIRGLVGLPESARRIAVQPPFVVERHQAVLETLAVPPLPAPVLFVHTGGKPFSYRASRGRSLSLPGLVTAVPAGVPARILIGGIGAGTVVRFEDDRDVPPWLRRWRPREPLTFVDNLIVSLVQQLAVAEPPAAADDYLAALGTALLAQLRHALADRRGVTAAHATRSSLLLAHRAVQHIHADLQRPTSVADLARHVGVGVTHFSQTFKAVTGTTPHRYLLRARLERGSEMLRMTSLSVGEVAAAVGFAGQSHFCTAFTRQMGSSPVRYRRRFHT
jgi:AraC family transcriptional regulator